MTEIRRLTGAALALLLCATPAHAQQADAQQAQEPRTATAAFALARQAEQAGDSGTALRYLALARSFIPSHPLIVYELARAQARTGDHAAALATLADLAALGTVRDPLPDSVFAGVDATSLAAVAARLRAGAEPLIASAPAFTVPDADLIPESIAYDVATGDYLIGSMGRRKIVRRRADGSTTDFVAARADSLGEVIGMKVHPTRRELWVASFRRDPAEPKWQGRSGGSAALFRYDLADGRLLATHAAPDAGVPHLLNDFDFAADGTVYVTDSHAGAVYRMSEGGALERWYDGSAGFSYPNGITMSDDGRRLYVAHFEGITVLDPHTGAAERLTAAGSIPTTSFDGLYVAGRTLVGIQRADGFHQVVALDLSEDGMAAVRAQTLERRHHDYDTPTTGVLVGDTLYYIANSQLPRLQDDGTVAAAGAAPAPAPASTQILALPVPPARLPGH